jgi:hypothetical protein
MAKLGVVYLDRWGNPPRFARIFLETLWRHPPGAPFTLYWQYKGYPENAANPALAAFRETQRIPVEEARYPDDLYQFNLAYDLAAKTDCDRLLFFISWSRILAPHWLRFYAESFERIANCGAVGATGSYERLTRDQPFPNVHLRTNAFMIAPSVLLRIDPGRLTAKEDGNRFEAGPNNMTRQLTAMGLVPLVIDRAGRAFRSEEWPQSRTFRTGHQEGLLVADNRTHEYAVAGAKKRRKLVRLAWGEDAPFTPANPLRRLNAWADWRWPHTP